jgi:hypothetical protein
MKIEMIMNEYRNATDAVNITYSALSSEIFKRVAHLFGESDLLFTPHFGYPELRVTIHHTDKEMACPTYLATFSDMTFYIEAKGISDDFISSVYKALKEADDD